MIDTTSSGVARATPTTAPVRAAHLRTLEAGAIASVSVVLLINLAIYATPHRRGIDFFPALRFDVVTPIAVAATVGAAFAAEAIAARFERPRRALAGAIAAAAALLLVAMAAFGARGLAGAALPALIIGAAAIAWRVPGALEVGRRSLAGKLAIVAVAALELAGVVRGLAAEASAPTSAAGLPFDVPRALFDVDHKFMGLPSGARIHYVDEGRGETLLFLHGNPSWSFQWRELIAGLRGSYRCVALDYPGFGMSDGAPGFGFTPREESQVVEEFVDKLGLRDMTLVMQDWGGPIGLGLAGRRPELVRRVVLGSTWAWPTTTAVPRGKFSVIAGGPIGEFVQVNFNTFAAFGIRNGIVKEPAPGVMDAYLSPFLAHDRRGIAAFYPGQINAATDWFQEVQASLPRLVDKPALIFWAGKDQGFTPEDLARMEAAFPRHTTTAFPNANHFFFEDEAAAMIPAIAAFGRAP